MQDTNINIKTFTNIANALQSPFARLAVRRRATMSILIKVPPGGRYMPYSKYHINIKIFMYETSKPLKVRFRNNGKA